MAPLSTEPDEIRVVLNMARRKVFYGLVSEITAYMRSQLELQSHVGSAGTGNVNPPPYSAHDTLSAGSTASYPGTQHGRNQETAPGQSVPSPQSPALVRLRKAALLHFDSWRAETLSKLKEVVAKADDQKIIDARRKRTEALSLKPKKEPVGDSEDLLSFDAVASTSQSPLSAGLGHGKDSKREKELEAFQSLYHPIPTRLTTIPLRDREEVLSATLLLLLSSGNYSAYSRTLICYLASALEITPSTLNAEETAIATTMVETAQKADAEAKTGMSADTEAQKRRDEGRTGRLWKVGLASVAGAAIIGVTGGLAAPVVAATVGGLMSSVGLGGLAGFLGIFWMNGALVGTLFGAFGAKMTGEMVDRYAKEVEDFKFLPLSAEWGQRWKQQQSSDAETRRLRVTIGINGWLETEDDVTKPWRVLGDESEVFALRYEMSSLMSLGEQLRALVGSATWSLVRAEILKRTVLVTLQGALWPILLLNSASSIDNPFSLARNRSEKAGQILADALINKVQGERPVTLIGYSLGARVIYACLRVLAERRAFGLVDTVVLIGAPVPSNTGHWQMMRTVVAGKLFNVHSENDYILGFLYRGTSLQLGIAGLQSVGAEIEGVEDLDLSDEVHGHLRYPGLIAQILHRCGFANVKGGVAAIEKEKTIEGGIEMRDKDYAELGHLIDIDDDEADKGPRPLLPPRRTKQDLANEKFDPIVKSILEQKSDARTLDLKLMSRTSSDPNPTTSTSSRPALNFLAGPSSRGDSTTMGTRSVSFPQPGPPDRFNTSQDMRSSNDSDEEYGEGPITMLDDDELSEGELTMVEPLSIDDEPLR
ncbi:DUF726-domain-containing protein [Xylaria bambusicola]|uniref:DUF726-domain-containing protein n=1 Tax=Xylaria bambusicola TaxID=326684 RepID=UPI002007CC34|nr:DUF726-domain-containing protein [Xylaria bambusicola]KAI0522087.1 DUF726-domain-containing protein [Xylaria bambusicola]